MASNLFGRYIWLVSALKHFGKLSFNEINHKWRYSGLNYGENCDLPLRTFNNHRKAISDIFGIDIECDLKDNYKYYISNIEELENNTLYNWLIDSYTVLNQLQIDYKLKDKIIFEDMPSGQRWLTTITNAIKNNLTLHITHKSFWKLNAHSFDVEPYCLRAYHQRWYLIARRCNAKDRHDEIRTYALDRIESIIDTNKTFSPDKKFNSDDYFNGCCGIISSNSPIERVVIRAYGNLPDYLRSLPLHDSQLELYRENWCSLFEYHIKPTFDFYQFVMSQGEYIEVLEPESVRQEVKRLLNKALERYKQD